jgi:endonuclease III
MTQKKISAEDLGIDLTSQQESAYFKWFLACLLFGKPIQQEVAKRAYLALVDADITTPDAILQAGWDRLVAILDSAHYVRYDFSTATKLLDVARSLKEQYGTLTELLHQSQTAEEAAARLQAFKGIGPKTADIFLRDLAPLL